MEINQKVTPFVAEATNGEFALSDYAGKIVVLYFYPRDNTSGCIAEGLDFSANYKKFKDANAQIIGVSRDTIKTHNKFIEKYAFPFPLIADPRENLCSLFDVMRDKNMYGKKVCGIERSTFIIDTEGVLRNQWRKVKIPNHVNEVLAAVQDISKKIN